MEMRIRESNGIFKVTITSLAGQELAISREYSGGLTFEFREVEEVEEESTWEAMQSPQATQEEVILPTVPMLKEETATQATSAQAMLTQATETAEVDATVAYARNNELFHKLSDLRRELATAEKVPPYLIFHDKTLWGMVENMPKDLPSLSKISGVGASKLEKYGSAFLSALHGA